MYWLSKSIHWFFWAASAAEGVTLLAVIGPWHHHDGGR